MRSNPRDDSGLVAAAKRLRVELLTTKGELERELGRCSCNAGGATGESIGSQGVSPEPGDWGPRGDSAERSQADLGLRETYALPQGPNRSKWNPWKESPAPLDETRGSRCSGPPLATVSPRPIAPL
jgi:hypothetical protein